MPCCSNFFLLNLGDANTNSPPSPALLNEDSQVVSSVSSVPVFEVCSVRELPALAADFSDCNYLYLTKKEVEIPETIIMCVWYILYNLVH